MLSAAAYVHLCLGDPVLALEHARKLLSQRLLAPAQRLLGHLYAAEALVLLDRADEALEHLSPELSGESGGGEQRGDRGERGGRGGWQGTGRTPAAGVSDGERSGRYCVTPGLIW